jgi:hypothetical protein
MLCGLLNTNTKIGSFLLSQPNSFLNQAGNYWAEKTSLTGKMEHAYEVQS